MTNGSSFGSSLLAGVETDLKPWIVRVASMREQDARDAVNDVPDTLMSEKRKEFTCKLLSLRQAWLLDWWKGQT